MIGDNLTEDESDNSLFDGRIKFFKSDGSNSFHSVEPVVASDDEDAEEKHDEDEPGWPDDLEEAGGHGTCTPLGEKLKEEQHHSSLTRTTTVDNYTPSSNHLMEYKNIILTLKKFNESVDSAFDCNIVNLFVEEEGRQKIVEKKRNRLREEVEAEPQKEQVKGEPKNDQVKGERQEEQKKIAKLGKERKKILNALLPLESCNVSVKGCNSREQRIGQLPRNDRSVGGVEEFAGGVVLHRARCVSRQRHHDSNRSLEEEEAEEAQEEAAAEVEAGAGVEVKPARNSLRRKGEHLEGNERVHIRVRHLVTGSHFIRKAATCKGSSPLCTQGFNSSTCSMTSNAGGSSTAKWGIEPVEEASVEFAIEAVDPFSKRTGADDRGEDKTPCSEDADPLEGMDGKISSGKRKLGDDEDEELNRPLCGNDDDGKEKSSPNARPSGSPYGTPKDHAERRSIKSSAPFFRSPSYHDISDNYSAVYSSRKSAEGCYTWRGKSVKLEDSAEQSEAGSTPFCVPSSFADKRLDGKEFPFLCYYGCGGDALQPRLRQRKWSVQSGKTMEKRITIRRRRKSVPSEYTCRRRVSSGTDISNIANKKNEEVVEGLNPYDVEGTNQSENPFYIWSNKHYRGGCFTNEEVFPKFKPLSNGMEETHNDELHFINTSVRKSNCDFHRGALSRNVYLSKSSAKKEESYVGKSQGGGLNPWEDPREGQVKRECGHDGEVYTKEGIGRIPFLSPSAGMYSRDTVEKDDFIVRGGCPPLFPPFKGLKVNYGSSGDLSWRASDGGGQHRQGEKHHPLEKNPQPVEAGQAEPSKRWSGFQAEKDIFFEAIKNIIRIMKEIKKIKLNLKMERNYSLVIQDKERKNELVKLIDYLSYQKEVRKKLKKHYFDKINKGLFTFLLRSNRANFFFTEEEVKLLKRWNEIKYTKMSSNSGGNTEGEEGDGGRTCCPGKSDRYVEGGLSDRRKILHQLRHLNNAIGRKEYAEEEANGRDNALWTNWGYPPGEAPCRRRRQRKSNNMKDSIRRGYLASTPSRIISYESYFTHCEKNQRNIFNIFLCLKNVKKKCVSKRFKRKIKNGQIYLSKIYHRGKMLSHVKYILEEVLKRRLPEIVSLHINDCFVDGTISFFISLLMLLFKNVNTIKVIRCHIYYAYLSVFLSYQKRNKLRSMHFVCNSIFWTRPPDFRNLRGKVHSAREQDSFLLYFNTNYVRKRKMKMEGKGDRRSNLRVDATRQRCRREDSLETSLKSCLRGRASPSNGAATGDYRIIVKRKKKVALFGVDEFYDCFVLGKEANVRGEADVRGEPTGFEEPNELKEPNPSKEPNGVDNQRMTLNISENALDDSANAIKSPAHAYNIHSGSGSDENTSEDSLKEELHECLCTFPRKTIQQANFSMLKKLKLCSNKLNDDALMYICTLIKKDKLKNLKILDLRWNNFTYRSLLALSLALTNTTVSEASERILRKKRKLHKLLLSGNNIKSPLYSSFLSSFCTCNFIVVKKLDFSMNVIDNDSFAITLKYFKHIFQLQRKRPEKRHNIGDVFINLDHNNLKDSPYINKLAQLLKKFPSGGEKSNGETPTQGRSSIGEESRQGVLLSLQYNNIRRGTLGEDLGRGSTSRIKF
ncbi:hypothetical protein C922_02080 [Plasmodium inui San Antonio 1]|uniref:Leucine-rich repeat protein n=1 Tax=Plasmodium inui San Antonio 1 TaxID=1237626 RepID=W7AE39_9APIC|nr:hypothetical protein C922_02080 [Plasmodium inui San Antonio 1]EUD67374.1 hypothetical protein C922_02080 [Plasmodium inui San Antonio 1]